MAEVASRRTLLKWTGTLAAAGLLSIGLGMETTLLLRPSRSFGNTATQSDFSIITETNSRVPTEASTQDVTEIATQPATATEPQTATQTAALLQSASINVTVLFVGMSPSIIQPSSNTVRVQSPAKFSDLEAVLWQTYPVLQTMDAMQVFINGISVDGDPNLNDGDEVVYVAMMAGG